MDMGGKFTRLLAVLAVSTAAASACTGEGSTTGVGGGSGDGGGPIDTPSDPCAHLARAKCTNESACRALFLVISYGDVATCEAVETARCNAALALDGVTATPDDISACAGAIEGQSCDGFSYSRPAACDAAARGSRPDGAPCAVGMQCASAVCGDRDATGCGRCFEELAEGEPCDPEYAAPSYCGDGLFCHDTGICMREVESGGACEGGKVCAGALQCIAWTCAEPAQLGAPCDSDECNLVMGLTCDPGSNTCAPAPFAGPGEKCLDMTTYTYTFCKAGSTCNLTTGICEAGAQVGQACDEVTKPSKSCVPGAQCVNFTCSAELPVCG